MIVPITDVVKMTLLVADISAEPIISTPLVTTEPVKNPTEYINFTALIYSVVNGLYKITTQSIKLVLDVEQFGVSSNLIVLTSSMHPR